MKNHEILNMIIPAPKYHGDMGESSTAYEGVQWTDYRKKPKYSELIDLYNKMKIDEWRDVWKETIDRECEFARNKYLRLNGFLENEYTQMFRVNKEWIADNRPEELCPREVVSYAEANVITTIEASDEIEKSAVHWRSFIQDTLDIRLKAKAKIDHSDFNEISDIGNEAISDLKLLLKD